MIANRCLKEGKALRRLSRTAFLAADGFPVTVDWRRRSATVLVFLHDANCIACRAFEQRLGQAHEVVKLWGGQILTVWRGQSIPSGSQGLADPAGAVRRLALDGDSAGVAVVDAQGVVVKSLSLSGTSFPDPDTLVGMVKSLVLQCPECGVPDGGWASLTDPGS